MTKATVSKNSRKLVVKYILLDVHGVLTEGDERKKFLLKMKKKYAIDYDLHNELWSSHIENLDKGIEKETDYIKLFNKTFHTNISVEEYYLMFLKEIQANKVLLDTVSNFGNIEVYIASDNVPQISEGLNKILGQPYQKLKKNYSFELGTTKGEKMLQKIIHKLGVLPNECLFIDDSSKNIEAARKLGINAILFKTNEQLFNELKKYNIIVEKRSRIL